MRAAVRLVLLSMIGAAHAQPLTVYDDALRNDFVPGYSYNGTIDLANPAPVHAGTASIAFTSSGNGAISFPNEVRSFDTSEYAGLRLWVHGGADGGQQLRLRVYSDLGATLARDAELDAFITGGAVVANAWRLVEVRFADLPTPFSGVFQRIDLQVEGAGVQPTLLLDDVTLLVADTTIFADGFEGTAEAPPELLFVPQFTLGGTGSIRVYERGIGGFAHVHTAALPANTNPNAVAFAPDGKLWVVDGGNPNRLLRYDREAMATDASPAAEAIVTPSGNAVGDYFDLAFYGDFAYVSQSDFGATHRVLKLPLASLSASGSPDPVVLVNDNLSVPAGLEFDPQGRLWVSNFSGQTLVRMDAATGNAELVANSVNLGARASLSNPEGLAFDADGTLWVGNNGAPTMAGYSAAQIDAGFAANAPAYFIDVEPGVNAPGNGHTGFVGGLAFDGEGDLWANYQRAFSVIEYDDPATGNPGQTLTGATTDPGFGGLAFWPVPATLQRGMAGEAVTQFRGTTLVGMEAPFTSYDEATGPVQDTHYPRLDEKLVDYFAGKGMSALRILVGWEALQSQLMGPIPAAQAGNYRTYFDNYLRVVDYATNVHGMTVLVTPWQFDDNVNGQGFGGVGGPTWRGGRVGTEVPIAAWSDFWFRLADHFKDNPRVQYVLVTEPNNMSTLQWFAIAQAGITAIRNTGSTQRIHVPGNGYSAASTWNIGNAFYDTDAVKRSNAYGWLNANGSGQPLVDPAANLAVEVHSYVDTDQGGVSDEITSVTALRTQLANTVDWARAQGLRVYLGETGMHATTPVNGGGTAQQAWDDFIAYFEANADTLEGFSWWAGGDPRGWWTDQGANGGGHYAISPLHPNSYLDPDVSYSGDTVNMDMIEGDF